jgi:hypothetical protein
LRCYDSVSSLLCGEEFSIDKKIIKLIYQTRINMMSINLALVIVLSVMVAVLWCNKCNENFGVGNFNLNSVNFNNRSINSDARRGPGTGKYNTRALSPTGWAEIQAVHDPEGFSGGCAGY